MTTIAIKLTRGRTAHMRQGYVLVLPDGAAASVPLCCPVCLFAMATSDDESSFLSHGCCHFCEMEWVQPDRAAWLQGKRPSPERVAEAASRRPPVVLRIN